MGSLSDWAADKDKEEREKATAVAEAFGRRKISDMVLTEGNYEDILWLWMNRNKILAQRKLIDMIGHW